ncbi:SOH1-domain-containing protein [Auriculariales sp. MPI-PUGE-AT-0066]|nr:SOH1-domain-containing protein [Auriculariales sp. MPI-PUGE-AT-0066]
MSAEAPDQATFPRALNRERFELELEFVQSLANPYYLQQLAQHGILQQPEFVNYLDYLQYWKQRDYARFIQYPHALHHLDLLQKKAFREQIAKDEWRDFLNQKQFDHWRTWRVVREPASSSRQELVEGDMNARRESDAVTVPKARFRSPGTAPGSALPTPLPNGIGARRDS